MGVFTGLLSSRHALAALQYSTTVVVSAKHGSATVCRPLHDSLRVVQDAA